MVANRQDGAIKDYRERTVMDVPPRALVVDDDAGVRMVISAMLAESGYQVSVAKDGCQALEQLGSFTPDIVFTDMNMPRMGGLEFIVKLKDRVPDTPIVVVSGSDDMQSAIEAIRRGAWEYIIKPIGLDSLNNVTNRTLERARLIRENKNYQERLEELVLERTRELKDSEMRYRTLFETANDAIVLIQSGIIQSCNKKTAELFGTEPDIIVGRSLLSFLPFCQPDGKVSGEMTANYECLALAGKPQFYELRCCRQDGTVFDAEISTNCLELQGVPHLLAIMRDVTERKKADAALLENTIIRRELDLAREIQLQLLPKAPPSIPGLHLACSYHPAASVGGDYYDFFEISPNVMDIIIADVSGHSIGSALLMSEARTVLRAKVNPERPPATLLAAVNELMHEDLSRAELQISAFTARLDTLEKMLTYANAGHTQPLLFRASSGEIEQLDAAGMLLGVVRELEFEERQCRLARGDILLFHTDGLIEAENSSGQFFGTERLSALLTAGRNDAPEDILTEISRQLIYFKGDNLLSDDVSLVLIKIDAA